ncbi:MAG: hypothetical protein KAT17_06945 [Candidatus Aminicenantes bacterium]|nr:hypothetical protein [Candidatus Aminicenantes bacterium]
MNRLANKIIIFFSILSFYFLCWGEQEKTSRTINEIKIPVRVFSEGKPIDTLQKSDFKIFISGQPLSIEQFKLVHRTLKPEPNLTRNPRLFLLLCNIFDHNLQVRKCLEYIFDQILQENDRLIIVFNTGTYNLDRVTDKHQAGLKINRIVNRHGSILNRTQVIDIKRLEESINYLRQNAESISGNDAETVSGGRIHQHYYMKYFKSSLTGYLNALQIYIQKYFYPNVNRYRKLLAKLKNFPGEKWIIHLYQMGRIPRLSKKNRSAITKMIRNLTRRDWTEAWMDEIDYAKQLKKLQADIDDALKISPQFPSDKITDLLYIYNWTFNSIFLAGSNNMNSTDSGSDNLGEKIKKKWQEVSEKTGGCFIDSNKSESMPVSLENVNDAFYLLSFNPENLKPTVKIKIEPRDPGYQIFYSTAITPGVSSKSDREGIPEIWNPRIRDIAFKQNKLSVIVSNLPPEKTEKSREGELKVQIEIVDQQNRIVFNEQRNLLTKNDTIGITVNIDWIKRGKHTVIIEITDLFSGRSELKFFQLN